MKKLEYTVRFNTPAFLGNAEQNAQWRTPPFKALLRQWWRVAYAADHGFRVDVAEMRHEEGLLFGHAWLDDDRDAHGQKVAARKSALRLRLDRWDEGNLKKSAWPEDVSVSHPEVKKREGKLVPVGSALYQGFGPLVYDRQRRTTTLKANAAIQSGEHASLSIAVPDVHAPLIERTLMFMDRYGTVGGRSRNGWGSFALLPSPASGRGAGGEGAVPLRPWRDALNLDWPHAIGQDDKGPLIWQTAPAADWKSLMKQLAQIKIGLRTQKPHLEFSLDTQAGDGETKNGINHGQPQDRHWLSYPVTNHDVSAWKRMNARLPNSLRFKVRKTADNQLVGVIFHVPCRPPAEFNPDHQAIERVWQRVHAFLDIPAQQLTRIPA